MLPGAGRAAHDHRLSTSIEAQRLAHAFIGHALGVGTRPAIPPDTHGTIEPVSEEAREMLVPWE